MFLWIQMFNKSISGLGCVWYNVGTMVVPVHAGKMYSTQTEKRLIQTVPNWHLSNRCGVVFVASSFSWFSIQAMQAWCRHFFTGRKPRKQSKAHPIDDALTSQYMSINISAVGYSFWMNEVPTHIASKNSIVSSLALFRHWLSMPS